MIETLMYFASSGWVRRRYFAFLLMRFAVGGSMWASTPTIVKRDVGIEPYHREIVISD